MLLRAWARTPCVVELRGELQGTPPILKCFVHFIVGHRQLRTGAVGHAEFPPPRQRFEQSDRIADVPIGEDILPRLPILSSNQQQDACLGQGIAAFAPQRQRLSRRSEGLGNLIGHVAFDGMQFKQLRALRNAQ